MNRLSLMWLVLMASAALCQSLSRQLFAFQPPAAEPQPLNTGQLHNVWRLSPRIVSGSEPEGEESFRELAALGIKTIVSVDGIAPRLDLAKKYGLRYVHVPIGYDGIEPAAALALTRVGQEDLGPIYVHCHHGKHRGPAAAAIVCRAADGRTAQAARLILEKAGTGKEYAGLWRDVENYKRPEPGTALPQLTEKAQVPSLATAMAKIDRHFDHLKLIQSAGWRGLAEHPDLVPSSEAVQLRELFAESTRVAESSALRDLLGRSTGLAQELEVAIQAGKNAEADKKMLDLAVSCKACHERHRNTK